MTLTAFETTQPIAAPFFRQALQSRTMAHAFVLKGRGMDEMYRMALEIAKVLNCSSPPQSDEACGNCSNCHWVDKNSHPAVITISRLTYLMDDEGNVLSEKELAKLLSKKGDPQTQIKVGQIQGLLRQLAVSSEYCRVVIFTDAEEKTSATVSRVPPPSDWLAMPGRDDKSFHLRPLERSLFNAASANRFLKTLEEPPPNTLFFFLTDSEDNLLETIVSRCQVVPFVTTPDPAVNLVPPTHQSFLNQISDRLPRSPDFYPLVAAFEDFFVAQEGLSLDQALETFQRHLREEFSHKDVTPEGFARYSHWIKQLETAKTRLDAKTNNEQTLNSLFMGLSRS